MSGIVFDAYSLIAYLEREPDYEQVKAHLEHAAQTGRNILLCVVNWGEVYYTTMREAGQAKAEEARHIIETLPIELMPADPSLSYRAAIYKATYKMSYADCFAAALTKTHKATLVTGDKDFKQLEDDVKISWL